MTSNEISSKCSGIEELNEEFRSSILGLIYFHKELITSDTTYSIENIEDKGELFLAKWKDGKKLKATVIKPRYKKGDIVGIINDACVIVGYAEIKRVEAVNSRYALWYKSGLDDWIWLYTAEILEAGDE